MPSLLRTRSIMWRDLAGQEVVTADLRCRASRNTNHAGWGVPVVIAEKPSTCPTPGAAPVSPTPCLPRSVRTRLR
jgi:hypothetical protein